jgi:hypothetical protein
MFPGAVLTEMREGKIVSPVHEVKGKKNGPNRQSVGSRGEPDLETVS